jgi:hypothetical protein
MSRMHFRSLTRGLSFEPMMGFVLLVPLVIVLAHAVGAWWLTRAAARRIERDEG